MVKKRRSEVEYVVQAVIDMIHGEPRHIFGVEGILYASDPVHRNFRSG